MGKPRKKFTEEELGMMFQVLNKIIHNISFDKEKESWVTDEGMIISFNQSDHEKLTKLTAKVIWRLQNG
jgi:hypothetical protein